MSIERLDMSRDIKEDSDYIHDVEDTYALWYEITKQVKPRARPLILPPPAAIEYSMRGLDHFVERANSPCIIGAVALLSVQRPDVNMMKIDTIAVHPDYQRRGIARSLAERSVEYAKETGHTQLISHALPTSRHLFETLGFEPYEENTKGAMGMFLDLN
jgi:GNAT superfamily N-acetyltransferase